MVVATHQPEDGDNKNEDEVFGCDPVTQKKFSLKQSAFQGTFKPKPLLKNSSSDQEFMLPDYATRIEIYKSCSTQKEKLLQKNFEKLKNTKLSEAAQVPEGLNLNFWMAFKGLVRIEILIIKDKFRRMLTKLMNLFKRGV